MAWGYMRAQGVGGTTTGTITRKAKRISMSGSWSNPGSSITVNVSDILSELSDSQAQKLTASNFLVGLDDAIINHDSSASTSVAQRVMVSSYSPSARTVTLQYQTAYNSSSISANLYVFYAE